MQASRLHSCSAVWVGRQREAVCLPLALEILHFSEVVTPLQTMGKGTAGRTEGKGFSGCDNESCQLEGLTAESNLWACL